MPKSYATSDIHVAATLRAAGVPMTDTTRSQHPFGSRPRAVFHFQDGPEVRRLILEYTNDSLQLNPRVLFEHLKGLKSLCHNLV